MAFSDEVCKLVIENIDLLEEAPSVVEEVETKVFREINNRMKSFLAGRDGWKDDGAYTYYEDHDDAQTTFAPIGWPEDEDTNYTAYYSFTHGNGENYIYWLTALVGKTNADKFGIYFNLNTNSVGMNKRQWKNYLTTKYQSEPILQESVLLEECTLCIPIVIDFKLLVEEYPLFDKCLKPVDDALEILIKINPYIDAIVKKVLNAALVTDQKLN